MRNMSNGWGTGGKRDDRLPAFMCARTYAYSGDWCIVCTPKEVTAYQTLTLPPTLLREPH